MKFRFAIILLLASFNAFSWGKTGHRVVGQVAEQYLSKRAKKRIEAILKHESVAIVGNWMDDIKSDPSYDHTHEWHWVTIPDSLDYNQSEKNPNGDIIVAIERLVKELKSGKLSKKQETEHLKMLVHLVGDLHQPLHVGRGDDKGGNALIISWFRQSTNLHRLWDSDLIDHTQLSYTELAASLPKPNKNQIREWQSTGVIDWANESKELRARVYDIPKDKNLNWDYIYQNKDILELRLVQAGVRLAGLLNYIYG